MMTEPPLLHLVRNRFAGLCTESTELSLALTRGQ
jgi:hypothetical protein